MATGAIYRNARRVMLCCGIVKGAIITLLNTRGKMQREVRIGLGQTGSGKSWGAAQFYATCPRAIVAECGYNEFPGLHFEEFDDMVLYLDRIGAFKNQHVPFRVSYSPRIVEYPLMFETALAVKNCWLFLEEADRFGDPQTCWQYDEVITRGRHDLISIYALSVRPPKLPIDLRAQATSLISFRQTEPADIKWIAEKVGDLAYELQNLPGPPQSPPFPFLEWDGVNGARIVDVKAKKK